MTERDDLISEPKSAVRFSEIDDIQQDDYRSVKNEYDDGGPKTLITKQSSLMSKVGGHSGQRTNLLLKIVDGNAPRR